MAGWAGGERPKEPSQSIVRGVFQRRRVRPGCGDQRPVRVRLIVVCGTAETTPRTALPTDVSVQIDTTLSFCSDSNGGDPDSASPTLRAYHRMLWSKPLPNGRVLELTDTRKGSYLYHMSELGEFFLGSDAITHSYRNHRRKRWLTEQIPHQVNELFDAGSTIGAYIIFPNKRIGHGHTINQARGVDSLIDDRFDLTLECIRRFYLSQESPLYSTLWRYQRFFALFCDFEGYTRFFLLEDLVGLDGRVKFYLPFDDFRTRPAFSSVDEYLWYKNGVMEFVRSRNRRIEDYVRDAGHGSGRHMAAYSSARESC
mgnify:FL=1